MTLPMEKAYYAARATSAPITFGEAENENKTKSIAIQFEILDEQFVGETITWIGHFTDKSAARTIESLGIAGWQGDDLAELQDAPGSSFLAEEVSLACAPEQDDKGEWRLKANWVNKPGGPRFAFKKPIAGNDLKAFAAQMRATVKSVKASGGAPRQTKAAPSGGGYSGSRQTETHPNAPGSGVADRDDIPFASADAAHESSPIARLLR